MAASSTKSWSDYAKWVNNIGRNMRISEPKDAELTAVKDFVKAIWDNAALTGTRPWLSTTYDKKSVRSSAGPRGDVDVEPTHVIVELLVAIAEDMNGNISITTPEGDLIDTLIAASSNRRFGTGDTFGGTGGSKVTVV
jgi:hypothetical protein